MSPPVAEEPGRECADERGTNDAQDMPHHLNPVLGRRLASRGMGDHPVGEGHDDAEDESADDEPDESVFDGDVCPSYEIERDRKCQYGDQVEYEPPADRADGLEPLFEEGLTGRVAEDVCGEHEQEELSQGVGEGSESSDADSESKGRSLECHVGMGQEIYK